MQVTFTESAAGVFATQDGRTIGHVGTFCDAPYVYRNAAGTVEDVPTVAAGIAALFTAAMDTAPVQDYGCPECLMGDAEPEWDAAAAALDMEIWEEMEAAREYERRHDDGRDYEPAFTYHPCA